MQMIISSHWYVILYITTISAAFPRKGAAFPFAFHPEATKAGFLENIVYQ